VQHAVYVPVAALVRSPSGAYFGRALNEGVSSLDLGRRHCRAALLYWPQAFARSRQPFAHHLRVDGRHMLHLWALAISLPDAPFWLLLLSHRRRPYQTHDGGGRERQTAKSGPGHPAKAILKAGAQNPCE
jgi:hypothetical protein